MVYVVDTSVFLSDHKALEKLRKENIVIPLVVLTELEGKKNHPELGFAARETLRTLEKLRVTRGRLTDGINLREGGSIRIEINNLDNSNLPSIFRTPENDNRILAVAYNVSKFTQATLLSKDIALRLKASVAGVKAEDFVSDIEPDAPMPIRTVDVHPECIEEIYVAGKVILETKLPINTNVILKSYKGSALARTRPDGAAHLVRDRSVFDVRGRSAEQRFALDMLCDPSIGIVSIAGKAGTGKSLLALAAGLEAVVERREFNKVTVFRPLYAVGGQDLGFLPGDADEKMAPWAAAVFDALESFCGENVIDKVIEDDLLEVLPLTHIRGRTLSNSFVILDEVQNLDVPVILTALSRMGNGSKVALTYDVAQRDNLRVGRYDGIASVVSKLAGNDIFGHVMLQKSERSAIAELVSTLLD
jgi:PhoH-like ATPase